MKNLFFFFALICLAAALGVDVYNFEIARGSDALAVSKPLLYATCALLACTLIFLLIGFDMSREESQRSDLFTRRAHEQDGSESTFQCDGRTSSTEN